MSSPPSLSSHSPPLSHHSPSFPFPLPSLLPVLIFSPLLELPFPPPHQHFSLASHKACQPVTNIAHPQFLSFISLHPSPSFYSSFLLSLLSPFNLPPFSLFNFPCLSAFSSPPHPVTSCAFCSLFLSCPFFHLFMLPHNSQCF